MVSKSKKLVMLTAYDFPTAKIADAGGVDLILVGDSAANVVHGFSSTTKIGMEEMLVHVKAVCRAKTKAMVIADMPHKSYDNPLLAVENATKFIEAGADAVKLEGFKPDVVEKLVSRKINVMGHLGHLPQTHKKPKIKGKIEKEENEIIKNAKAMESAGCSWIVLELVKEKTSKKVTEALEIPTIGIGAGRYCTGQVLVFHDLLGFNADSSFSPRFLKKYANLKKDAIIGVKKYAKEVREGKFPSKKHCY